MKPRQKIDEGRALVFAPVVRKGLYEVSFGRRAKRFRAVDSAEAKFKFAKHFSVAFAPSYFAAVAVEKTIRVEGGAR